MTIRSDIINIVRETAVKAYEYMKKFQNYNYIWLEDKNLYLEKILTKEDPKDDSESSEELEAPNAINLRKFRMQVSGFMFKVELNIHKNYLRSINGWTYSKKSIKLRAITYLEIG